MTFLSEATAPARAAQRPRRGDLRARKHVLLLVIAASALASSVRADEIPPWTDAGDVPVPEWAKSVTPTKPEVAIYAEPGKLELRRGSAQPGARLPLYGTRRGTGCLGRWFSVGPLAWVCSDVADVTPDLPQAPTLGTRPWTIDGSEVLRPARPGATALPPLEPTGTNDDGLPYRYYFAGRDGAYGYANLATAGEDQPDQDLEQGFAVAALEERTAHGERWVRTKKGRWVALKDLVPARPSLFHGELAVDGKLDFAWVVTERVATFSSERADKANGARVRFEKVKVREETTGPQGSMLRVSDDDKPAVWMRARDVSRPRLAPPPNEIGGASTLERWIDVDLHQQVLTAYEGAKPIFATLVSTGKGPPGSEFATRVGVHRIWVKIFTTKMDNLGKEDVDKHYAIEDVPWVQFFDKAIALHGAFWHKDFGHIHSHGCVNLAPLDARWLFAFTGPHLPTGWTAVLPTKIEQGTAVRVR